MAERAAAVQLCAVFGWILLFAALAYDLVRLPAAGDGARQGPVNGASFGGREWNTCWSRATLFSRPTTSGGVSQAARVAARLAGDCTSRAWALDGGLGGSCSMASIVAPTPRRYHDLLPRLKFMGYNASGAARVMQGQPGLHVDSTAVAGASWELSTHVENVEMVAPLGLNQGQLSALRATGEVLVSTRFKMLGCCPPKSGSTSFVRNYIAGTASATFRDADAAKRAGGNVRSARPHGADGQHYGNCVGGRGLMRALSDTSYLTFVQVRHPFGRIRSVYRNQYLQTGNGNRNHFSTEFKLPGLAKQSTATYDVTFKELVTELYKQHPSSPRRDRHLYSQTRACALDKVQFDLVVHLENRTEMKLPRELLALYNPGAGPDNVSKIRNIVTRKGPKGSQFADPPRGFSLPLPPDFGVLSEVSTADLMVYDLETVEMVAEMYSDDQLVLGYSFDRLREEVYVRDVLGQ